MRKPFQFVTAIASALLINSVAALPDRVGDFSLLDSEGDFHQLSRYRHQDALVLMSYDSSCSSIDGALAQFKTMQSAFADHPVSFALINSSLDANIENIRAERARLGADVSLLLDSGQLVSETLSLSKTGELAILDPDRLTIVYRGGIEAVASQVLMDEIQGDADSTTVMQANGCDIQYPAKRQHTDLAPDYATEIAPIIGEQCASCHREGGIGPFAMDSHLMLQGWSPMIREVLLTKRMPPTQVDPNIGHFSNARYISDTDLQKLVHWLSLIHI